MGLRPPHRIPPRRETVRAIGCGGPLGETVTALDVVFRRPTTLAGAGRPEPHSIGRHRKTLARGSHVRDSTERLPRLRRNTLLPACWLAFVAHCASLGDGIATLLQHDQRSRRRNAPTAPPRAPVSATTACPTCSGKSSCFILRSRSHSVCDHRHGTRSSPLRCPPADVAANPQFSVSDRIRRSSPYRGVYLLRKTSC